MALGRSTLALVVLAAMTIGVATAAKADSNGLGDDYDWIAFKDDAALDKSKPTMLVVTKSWCGACKALKPAFAASAEIKALAPRFNMVNVADNDEPKDSRFAPDGGYIPRILFLASGDTHAQVMSVTNKQGNPKYKYYYASPAQIVAGMNEALELHAAGSSSSSSGSGDL